MSRAVSIVLQGLLFGSAIVLAVRLELLWLCIAAMAVLAGGNIGVGFGRLTEGKRVQRWFMALGWGWSALIVVGFQDWDALYALLAWLIAGAIFLTNFRISDRAAGMWCKSAGVAWAFGGGCIWLAVAYLKNRPREFFIGILGCLVLLVLCRALIRLPGFAIQLVNTAIILVVAIPIFDLLTRPSANALEDVNPANKYYSYEVARKHPAAFERWAIYFQEQFIAMTSDIDGPGTAHVLPFLLKPGSHSTLVQSRISINSKGFRGAEIADPKGDTYRIIALGESTTFGFTLTPDDKPWPELLEQFIRQRLKPLRRVEVINAGIPGFDLEENLYRLSHDILPLKPDMILSYHGCFNGLHLLKDKIGPPYYVDPPRYARRPLKILSDVEYRFKVILFEHQQAARLQEFPPEFSDPMESRYARDYERLIQIAQTNHIRLFLANYSMAVNSRSDPKIIAFYRTSDAELDWLIEANVAHSAIVRQLTRQHPEVGFVDTHPQLDGEHDKFIDFMHFNADGDRQMAEAFYAAIATTLAGDLHAKAGK